MQRGHYTRYRFMESTRTSSQQSLYCLCRRWRPRCSSSAIATDAPASGSPILLHSQRQCSSCFAFQFNVRPGRLEQLCRRLAKTALYLYYVNYVALTYLEERLRWSKFQDSPSPRNKPQGSPPSYSVLHTQRFSLYYHPRYNSVDLPHVAASVYIVVVAIERM